MTVFNLDTHQPIAFLPMAGGPDVIKFDPGLKRIYVGCSSGAISVFQMDDPTTTASWKTFRFRRKCTAWQWISKRIVFMHRSKRRTAKQSPEWLFTKPS